MKRFMCLHTVSPGSISKDQVCQMADALQHAPDIHGYRSFFSLSAGKACCILEASDKETLARWFDAMKLPYDEIVEVELEGEHGIVHEVPELAATA